MGILLSWSQELLPLPPQKKFLNYQKIFWGDWRAKVRWHVWGFWCIRRRRDSILAGTAHRFWNWEIWGRSRRYCIAACPFALLLLKNWRCLSKCLMKAAGATDIPGPKLQLPQEFIRRI